MISSAAEIAIREHALRAFPEECVGVIVGGEYLPLINSAQNRETEFRLAEYPHDAEAVIHSHTRGNADPQEEDMRSQQAHGRPWGIVATDGRKVSPITWFGDQVPPGPYVGRKFVNGQSDCWCLIRDIYRHTLGVPDLPNLPRNDDWFKGTHPRDLLSVTNIKSAGFFQVSLSELRPWDIALGSIGSRVTNHCGIYVGGNMMLHHVEGQLSCRVLINPWLTRIRHFLRHESLRDSVSLPSPQEVLP